MSPKRQLAIVLPATSDHGAIARDVATGERHQLCYSCGLPEDEHKPKCPKRSTTTFVEQPENCA